MSLPPPGCPSIPEPPEPLRIRIPGGITIEAIPPMEGKVITPLGAVQALLNQLGPAMAALQPIFLIINAVNSIIELIKTIPGLITGNVPDFIEALDKAIDAVAALLQFQPSLSLPFMIADMLNAIVTILTALRDLVNQLQELESKGQAVIAEAQAAGDAALEASGECIVAQADAYSAHVTASLGPLNHLLDMLQILMGLLPNPPPEIPGIGDAPSGLDALADFLDDLIQVFSAIEIPGA